MSMVFRFSYRDSCFELKEYEKALENLLEAEKLLFFDQCTEYNEAFNFAYHKIASVYEFNTEYEMCFSYLDKQIHVSLFSLIFTLTEL